MKILITNDDGISAPGILAVVEVLRDIAECLVVAPHKECSAAGHSITLHRTIGVETVDLGSGLEGFSIEGTPADCVKFAVAELAKNKIDLIVSGINPGLNSGVSVYYSGTVSAAREGLINGIPGMAVSQARELLHDFSYSKQLVQDLIKAHQTNLLPRDTFLNINIPPLPPSEIKGIRIVKQAHSRFVEWFELTDPNHSNGKKTYSIRGDMEVINPDGESDEEVLKKGFVSVTPLQLDLTHYNHILTLRDWMEKGFLDK